MSLRLSDSPWPLLWGGRWKRRVSGGGGGLMRLTLVTQAAHPALFTDALPCPLAFSMQTSREGDALVTVLSLPTWFAPKGGKKRGWTWSINTPPTELCSPAFVYVRHAVSFHSNSPVSFISTGREYSHFGSGGESRTSMKIISDWAPKAPELSVQITMLLTVQTQPWFGCWLHTIQGRQTNHNRLIQLAALQLYFSKEGAFTAPALYGNEVAKPPQGWSSEESEVVFSTCTSLASHRTHFLCCTVRCNPNLWARQKERGTAASLHQKHSPPQKNT